MSRLIHKVRKVGHQTNWGQRIVGCTCPFCNRRYIKGEIRTMGDCDWCNGCYRLAKKAHDDVEKWLKYVTDKGAATTTLAETTPVLKEMFEMSTYLNDEVWRFELSIRMRYLGKRHGLQEMKDILDLAEEK